MRIDEIRAKDDSELAVVLENLRRAQFDLRFKTVTGEVENPNLDRETRRSIARVLTILGERNKGIRGARTH
jgi:large subunit ribosomal protein L29